MNDLETRIVQAEQELHSIREQLDYLKSLEPKPKDAQAPATAYGRMFFENRYISVHPEQDIRDEQFKKLAELDHFVFAS